MRYLILGLMLILSMTACSKSSKSGIKPETIIPILLQGTQAGGTGTTTVTSTGTSGTSSGLQFPDASDFTKVLTEKTFTVFAAKGGGSGTLVQFSGHKHELNSANLGVEPIAAGIQNEQKNRFGRFVYVSYAMGETVPVRFEKIYPVIKELIKDDVTIVGTSAGTLYSELLKDKLTADKITVKKTIFIAGIRNGILLVGYEYFSKNFKEAADMILKIAPELGDYLPDSPFIKSLQAKINKNTGASDYCIAMDFFNSGADLVTSVDSGCVSIPSSNKVRIAGDHDINSNLYSLNSVTKAVSHILEKNSVPTVNSPLTMLPITWDTDLKQFVPAVVPTLPNTEVAASFVNNVPGFKISALNGDWEIKLGASLQTVNLEKNLISMKGTGTVRDTKKNTYFFAQNLFGEIVYNIDYYKAAGGSGRPAGFENYPFYLSSSADLSRQAPIAVINIMDVSAPIHFYGSVVGIQDHKNFRVRADISGHWEKHETFGFWPIDRTIDVRTNNLNIVYTKGIPSITGSLRLDGWGLGIDNIDTDCTFVVKETGENYIKFTSPQQIRADLIGIGIGQTSCASLIGGEITLQIIK